MCWDKLADFQAELDPIVNRVTKEEPPKKEEDVPMKDEASTEDKVEENNEAKPDAEMK